MQEDDEDSGDDQNYFAFLRYLLTGSFDTYPPWVKALLTALNQEVAAIPSEFNSEYFTPLAQLEHVSANLGGFSPDGEREEISPDGEEKVNSPKSQVRLARTK